MCIYIQFIHNLFYSHILIHIEYRKYKHLFYIHIYFTLYIYILIDFYYLIAVNRPTRARNFSEDKFYGLLKQFTLYLHRR
jgi:hypothetical protein